jgi:hypothetical protein
MAGAADPDECISPKSIRRFGTGLTSDFNGKHAPTRMTSRTALTFI